MKSKIRVEYDFENKEPYIQMYVDGFNGNETEDLRDSMLKAFIEQANSNGVDLVYPKNNTDNSVIQFRIKQKQTTD